MARPADPLTKNLVFIASGGRTGTQFLGDMLASVIDDCWSEHEADMFAGFNRLSLQRVRDFGLWHMLVGRALGQTGLRAIGTDYLTGRRELNACAARLRAERRDYHNRIAQSLIIDSYWRWWMFAGDVPAIFPGAKTVGIVRHPYSFIASWLSHQAAHSGGHWTMAFPPGQLTPARIGDEIWARRWDSMGPVARLAWEWRLIYQRIANGTERDSNARIFFFERIFDGEKDDMAELVRFVSQHPDRTYRTTPLDGFTQQRRNSSSASKDDWRRWSAADLQMVQDQCGPLMDRFGYAADGTLAEAGPAMPLDHAA